ncbi:putative intraflagellar transport protein IFT88 [Trypanosoma theileri]|uniref:Tetratricopeptide repeat protein 29 n=1 Tax=Trypanosoma theileri TaxID=67003 RepID=A0A1X0NYE0_9TRYP|nr:putative intraflagellar transport protein IFT88 [Trypanosoma theileri]ORC89621.1 putative intraflagellar transport protein IFT88 [Trypanosoma theileri]
MRKREVEIVAPSTEKYATYPVAPPTKGQQQQKQSKQQQKQKKQQQPPLPEEPQNQRQLILAPIKPPVRRSVDAVGSQQHTSRRRPPLITQSQRDALTVSAFGFGTTRHGPPDRSASSITGEFTTAATTTTGTATGGGVGVVLAQREKDSLRFHLCVDALADGCVATYIHLFQLAHRPPVCVDPLAQTHFTIPDDRLRWVREQLSAVEVLRRQSEFRDAVNCCYTLADYFESERDHEEAAWHYETALRYAMESLERPLEQEVRETYAAFFERRKQYRKALALYEVMYKLAIAIEDEKTANAASFHMMRTCRALAEEMMQTNPEEARRFLERALSISRRVGSGENEAACCYSLGILCEQLGDLPGALRYQQAFYEVSRREKLTEDEKTAALVVAGLQERMHMGPEAMESLQRALSLAREVGDLEGVCRATMQLGQAYKSSGEEEKALEYFRQNFETARQQNNQDLEDQARVALGFALGEYYYTHAGNGRGYVPIVCYDIKAQLEWMSNGVL